MANVAFCFVLVVAYLSITVQAARRTCTVPPPLPNTYYLGNITSTIFAGQTLQVACLPTHTATGGNTIVSCVHPSGTGTSSAPVFVRPNPLVCKPKSCARLRPPVNGAIHTDWKDPFVLGAVVRYSCNKGFHFKRYVAANRVQCKAVPRVGRLSIEWSDDPPSCAESCLPPSSSIGIVDFGHALVGSTVNMTCLPGYAKHGTSSTWSLRKCLSGGKFDGSDLKCTKLNCSMPHAPPNSTYRNWTRNSTHPQTGIWLGEQVVVQCNHGFWVGNGRTNFTQVCQADRRLSNSNLTCVPTGSCAAPTPLRHGAVSTTSSMPFFLGATLRYSCNTGYHFGRRVAGDQVRCIPARSIGFSSVEWSDDPPTCVEIPKCRLDTPPPYASYKHGGTVISGAEVIVQCNHGFWVNATTSVFTQTCQPDGQLSSPTVQCSPIGRSTTGSVVQSTAGPGVQPIAGPGVQPIAGSGVQPIAGSGVQPRTGSVVQPTTGSVVQPTTGSVVQPTTGSVVRPTTGSVVQPTTGSGVRSPFGSGVQPAFGSGVQPPTGPKSRTGNMSVIDSTSEAAVASGTGTLLGGLVGAIVVVCCVGAAFIFIKRSKSSKRIVSRVNSVTSQTQLNVQGMFQTTREGSPSDSISMPRYSEQEGSLPFGRRVSQLSESDLYVNTAKVTQGPEVEYSTVEQSSERASDGPYNNKTLSTSLSQPDVYDVAYELCPNQKNRAPDGV